MAAVERRLDPIRRARSGSPHGGREDLHLEDVVGVREDVARRRVAEPGREDGRRRRRVTQRQPERAHERGGAGQQPATVHALDEQQREGRPRPDSR